MTDDSNKKQIDEEKSHVAKHEVFVADPGAIELRKVFKKIVILNFDIVYSIPVLWYATLCFLNPDGVNIYGSKIECYTVSDKDTCLSKKEADLLGGGYSVTTRYQVLMIIGLVYALIPLIHQGIR